MRKYVAVAAVSSAIVLGLATAAPAGAADGLDGVDAPGTTEVAAPATSQAWEEKASAGTDSSAEGPSQQPLGAPSAGVFYTNGDNVHISSTAPASASGHGWWVKISGPGTKAKVTIELQALDHRDNKWKTVATGSKNVYSGTGSANRAHARKTCTNRVQKVQWRSRIDVDIIGVNDSPEKAITKTRSLWCGAF
ncbi:hypothetical protein HRW16_18125 [Streptomyces lunaelactis]|uniref:hypothetical protein n=1 Tax=Streptomyces lunaelactis TaxID=1535768 RepID=UPI001585A569|nr:hypothetical protein [Streptomyces lunaelactis]NUK18533.1 hypothetical protein [Streptomyces lunaelactis]NUK34803.1 hypothetical protein [Streptomyces lunaelactis]NUK58771.1 hypothetical protein [Streptomyces lunaelactis]NUK93727.1 hypothetical protein [Streptomyces lunaelactis]NUL11339.1 hypothetical protein [Streptomyces lunaelactis]